MPPAPLPALLDEVLRTVDRRYRLPPLVPASSLDDATNPAVVVATVIDEARRELADGRAPGAALQQRFVDALARIIRAAMDVRGGDPAFQAAVLRHRAPVVREYASLAAHAEPDRRTLRSAVNTIAHPARLERHAHAWQRAPLARLHAAAAGASWDTLYAELRHLLAQPETAADPAFQRDLAKLHDNPALARLQRLAALSVDPVVRQYRALWERQGPPEGSALAVAQGATSQRRGAAVEALAALALGTLADQLDAIDTQRTYRVVTSMRVPASIPGKHDRAKTEWDAVLLERARSGDPSTAWNMRFLVEAKASADAATSDLPRLLRGLSLLAQADPHTVYAFDTREGSIRVHGASLHALTIDDAALQREVLYCCDASADPTPRLLGAASRMQLLSTPASLAYASALAQHGDADTAILQAVWDALLTQPSWRPVLHQYESLRQVRALMVGVDDLLAAIDGDQADNAVNDA